MHPSESAADELNERPGPIAQNDQHHQGPAKNHRRGADECQHPNWRMESPDREQHHANQRETVQYFLDRECGQRATAFEEGTAWAGKRTTRPVPCTAREQEVCHISDPQGDYA